MAEHLEEELRAEISFYLNHDRQAFRDEMAAKIAAGVKDNEKFGNAVIEAVIQELEKHRQAVAAAAAAPPSRQPLLDSAFTLKALIFLNISIGSASTPQQKKLLQTVADKAAAIRLLYKNIGRIVENSAEKKPVDIVPIPTDNYFRPHDKVTTQIFDKGRSGEFAAAESIRAKTTPNNGRVLFSLHFDQLKKSEGVKLSQELTPYDRFIHDIICSLSAVGNTYISLRMIYEMMAGRGKQPTAEQEDKIKASIEKMRLTRIFIDNKHEAAVSNYKPFKYNNQLLPAGVIEWAKNRGQKLDYALELLQTPPLFRFAADRRQVSTIPAAVLTIPGKTNAGRQLDIKNHLIMEIERTKQLEDNHKVILLKSIFDAVGVDNAHKTRAKNDIKAALDHWKNIGYIETYTITRDRLRWSLPGRDKPKKDF